MIRVRVRVTGIVQGVGFRPFVHGLAEGLGLVGFVGNDERGVFVEVEGEPGPVGKLVGELERHPPPLATVERVSTREVPATGAVGFVIVPSASAGRAATLISPDTATCDDCLAELRDPTDRRYRYPFVNCTNCGPRFTIVTGVPYDRPATTMAGFPMCPACAREYHDPADRRFHAQPTCCPDCGPTLTLLGADGRPWGGGADGRPWGGGADGGVDGRARPDPTDPIVAAAGLLRDGAVLAIKGLGGFHLAALAGGPVGEAAVATLRARKHREDKPFAVLVADLAAARELVEVGPDDGPAAGLLRSRHRPIVVLPRRMPPATTRLATQVAPGNTSLGVMLPYTPLHHLLMDVVAEPIVLTSGNVSDEPIAYQDTEVVQRLRRIADGYLTHDRPIHVRADDSVIRVISGRVIPVRRSRGYAPEPLRLTRPARRPMLGCGAELKSTFCLARGGHAFLSHHIGDLENYETLRSYTTGIEHFRTLFDADPELLVHDLHPEYLSTKYAHAQAEEHGVELLGVQHHHAHLASCLADNGWTDGSVIGIACDGLGYGCDRQLWGGEVLTVSLAGFERLAHLEPVPMPGGAAAVREPWRMAAAYLAAAGREPPPGLAERQGLRWAQLGALLAGEVNTPLTSSTGRLFDAVAALLGVRDRVNYEGQAAVELEQLAWRHTGPAGLPAEGGYPARLDGTLLRGTDLVGGVLDDLAAGRDAPLVAARFHAGLVDLLARAAGAARARTGLDTVALSGGVFQNALLLGGLRARLEADGFAVLTHARVPPNDAGISLGQVVVAVAQGH